MPGNSLCAAIKIFLANRRFVFFPFENGMSIFIIFFFLSLRHLKKKKISTYIDNRSILQEDQYYRTTEDLEFTKCNTIFEIVSNTIIRLYVFATLFFLYSNFRISR